MNPNPKNPPPRPTGKAPDSSPSATNPQQVKTRARANATSHEVQRFQHGSGATNTLNTTAPLPCYVDHLRIREVWGNDKSKTSASEDKKHRDPEEISRDIQKYQKALEMVYYKLDDAALKEDIDYEAEKKKLTDIILRVQERLINLDMERIASQSTLAPYEPPTGVREFVIVEHIPPYIQDIINAAENKLIPLRTKLSTALEDWYKAHTEHEAAKKELMEFSKKKKELGSNRDKARNEYEITVREERDLAHNQTRRRGEAIRKLFKQDAQTKLADAQKNKNNAKAKFIAAQDKYRDFAFNKYGQIRTRERGLYNSLIAKLKEVNTITTQIGAIEAESQEAKNTLVSGSRIQMTSFERGTRFNEKEQLKKVPTVELELDGETRIFREAKHVCRKIEADNIKKHPRLGVIEEESKLNGQRRGDFKATFKIFENHRKVFKATGGILRIGIGVWTGVTAIFQHIFSAFPKKRYYQVSAETCGSMQTGMKVPARLEAELEVFPADVYTMSLKMPPALGYDNVVRDEKISDTTKIQGEAAYMDVENAASVRDHTVSSGESFSVFGVTQSSSMTTVTHGADGREIVNQTTMTRDGIFGTATIKDVSTGTFTDSETGAVTQYSGTMIRSAEIGSPGTDDPGGKLVSMQQTKTDEDGTVTDVSKSVDSRGVATAIDDDASGLDAGTQSGRPPSMPSTYLPQIPIDLTLICNGIEDPVTEDLRRTLGLVIFLVRKCGDIASRMGNMMPSYGWKFGFNMTFLAGTLSYTHDHREHVDKRVWLHHKFDIDLNIVTAKVFLFGGASYEFLIATIQAGIEVYVRGMIGVRGNFEKNHPDAEKKWDIGFGPTGSIGVGVEVKIIIGQPDWVSVSASIETVFSVEATYWMRKEGEESPFLEAAFKWEGIKLKAVAHAILIGHWEEEIELCKEREIWSGRFPKEDRENEIKQMLADQTEELEKSNRKRVKEAAVLEKKMIKKGIKPGKIKK